MSEIAAPQEEKPAVGIPDPAIEERFNIYSAGVSERDAAPEEGLEAVVQLQLDAGLPVAGVLVPLKRYVTGMDPDTAIAVGEGMVEAGRNLKEAAGRPKLDIVPDMATAKVVAERAGAAARLRG